MADIFIFSGNDQGEVGEKIITHTTFAGVRTSDTITEAAIEYLKLANIVGKNSLMTGPPSGFKMRQFVLRPLNEDECAMLSNLLCPSIKSVPTGT